MPQLIQTNWNFVDENCIEKKYVLLTKIFRCISLLIKYLALFCDGNATASMINVVKKLYGN